MKNLTSKISLLILSFVFLSFITPTPKIVGDIYNVDIQKSKIDFVAHKKSNYHTGFFPLQSGTLQVENGKLTGGKFTIDMANLKVTDGADDLGKHLLKPDFFDVSKFPIANFTINKVSYINDQDCNIEGSLNCKGLSIAVNFKATIESTNKEKGLFAHAYFNIDKTTLGISYGEGNINKQVQIAVYLFAK